MSTVKIKAEPAAATDVKVKLEPSLSTADIKLEQRTSGIDIKFEPGSDVDREESEEGDIKSESDDDEGDTDQNQAAATLKNRQQLTCERHGCGRNFNKANYLTMHQHEHRLQAEINIFGKTFTLTRQSLDDRWLCPFPDCTSTAKTVYSLSVHMRPYHGKAMSQQQQQPPAKRSRENLYFLNMSDFYVSGIRCGFHNKIAAFVCHECRLVPECLLTHLQQKHGFDEKSIDNSVLPDNAVNANTDPNTNQHTSNSHLAAAIRNPYQQHHQGIIQGWLCVTSDCGYCGYATDKRGKHKIKAHEGQQFETVSALVLRLSYGKTQASCFLIARIDQASGAVTTSNSRVNRHTLDYNHSGLHTQDENEDDDDQNETTDASNQMPYWKCDYPECGRSFNLAKQLSAHQREHKLEVVIIVQGNNYTLSRQSADDRWPCPIPDCEKTWKTIDVTYLHIKNTHSTPTKQKRANGEDDDNKQQQIIKRAKRTNHYLKVDDFYVSGNRCGYHTDISVFICHECRLVPDCLLTHLQQNHGYDEKPIDNSTLPESAVIANADPNDNQHTSNQHLASAFHEPSQPQHPIIVQGWLCVAPGCGYCSNTTYNKSDHKKKMHKGEQLMTVTALVLRLPFGRTQTSCYLISRLDTVTNNTAEPISSTSQFTSKCDDEEDDGDELVLSDYSDEDGVY